MKKLFLAVAVILSGLNVNSAICERTIDRDQELAAWKNAVAEILDAVRKHLLNQKPLSNAEKRGDKP